MKTLLLYTSIVCLSVCLIMGCGKQSSPITQDNEVINHPEKPSTGTFWEAVQNEDWSLMRRWVEYDPALVNSRGRYIDHVYNVLGNKPKNPPERLGMTPLFLATMRGNLEMVTFLIDNGADVNMKIDDGLAPLHIAALKSQGDKHAYVSIVKHLIDSGANVNLETTNEQRTPLNLVNPDNSDAESDIARMLSAAGGRKNQIKEGLIWFY